MYIIDHLEERYLTHFNNIGNHKIQTKKLLEYDNLKKLYNVNETLNMVTSI